MLRREASGYVDAPLRIAGSQVDPEQRDQDPVAMKCLQGGDIQVKPTAHCVAVPPLGFLYELFRSQKIDLTERILKRQQIQTRPGGRSKRASNDNERHRALTHKSNLVPCSLELLYCRMVQIAAHSSKLREASNRDYRPSIKSARVCIF